MVYDSGKPVGYITYRKKDQELEIMGLAVLPDYQNKGVVGTLLINQLFIDADKMPIVMVTHPHNCQAIRFYLKFGFKIIGWKDNYYGNNQPRLILQNRL